MTITDNTGKVTSETSAISKYFRKPDESLADFMNQLKALSPADKTELAIGAAKELGWTVSE